MTVTLNYRVLLRDDLASSLAEFGQSSFAQGSLDQVAMVPIPPKGALVGQWNSETGSDLPDLIVVNDNDLQDSLAWLASYFPSLGPITQWCRVLPKSAILRMSQRRSTLSLGKRLGPWVGAILAECSVQGSGQVVLRELPGVAALSTASFAAGRAVAVWGEDAELRELSRRHADLAEALRDGERPLTAPRLLPVWQALVGGKGWALSDVDRRPIEPFIELLDGATHFPPGMEPSEVVAHVARSALDFFDLPELAECSRGPQSDRVRALDRLGTRLLSGPKSPAIDALMGFAASLVDPGVAVLPDLLRKYAGQFPTAPIWLGAFAGAWAPFKVLSDHNGLGRLIMKALLCEDDLTRRPDADIAFDELARWIGPKNNARLAVRGMAARTLSVEIMHGVNAAFASGRNDTATRNELPAKTRASEPRSNVPSPEIQVSLQNLLKRIEKIEKSIGEKTGQGNLDLTHSVELEKPRRATSKPKWKK